MYCNKCGNKINEQEKFCGKCGNTVTPYPKTSPNNPLIDTFISIASNANELNLMGRKLSVTVISGVSIIIGLLYLASYYSVSALGETIKLNWFSSINYTSNTDEKTGYYVLAGSVVITILLLVGNALLSFSRNKITRLAKPALIISIISALIILFSVSASISEMEKSYGKLAEAKITAAPYIILILSIAALVGVIKSTSKKNQE